MFLKRGLSGRSLKNVYHAPYYTNLSYIPRVFLAN